MEYRHHKQCGQNGVKSQADTQQRKTPFLLRPSSLLQGWGKESSLSLIWPTFPQLLFAYGGGRGRDVNYFRVCRYHWLWCPSRLTQPVTSELCSEQMAPAGGAWRWVLPPSAAPPPPSPPKSCTPRPACNFPFLAATPSKTVKDKVPVHL